MDEKSTESKKNSQEAIQYLDCLFNYANSPIIVWNTKFQITRFSKAFESLTGRVEKDVIGKSMGILFPLSQRNRSMKLIKNTLEGERLTFIEIDILDINGSIHTLLWNSANIMSPDGVTPIASIAQGHNITKCILADQRLLEKIKELAFQNEEKEKRASELMIANKELAFQNEEKEKRASELLIAKERAEESDKLKSAFLANMSHEIRTPMNGILGFADLLKEPNLTGEMQQKYIEIIEKSGLRMLNIINNIVDISKIEAGMMNPCFKNLNVNEKIEFIYHFFIPETERKGIKLYINKTLPTKDAIIKSDGEKLFSILTNLVKNAIKYTQKGLIEIGYFLKNDKEPAELEFYVKDTGIGIPEDRQNAIFGSFIQADISDIKAHQGAGLGLSISKAYVEMLNGKIWLESEVDKGSVFYFTLPYIKD